MNILCSEAIQDFMNSFPYDSFGAESVINYLFQKMPSITNLCGFDFVGIYKGNKKGDDRTYYFKYEAEGELQTLSMNSVDGGEIVYEAKSNDWTPEKLNEFKFLCQLIFIGFGRAISMKLMKENLTMDKLTSLPNKNAYDSFIENIHAQNALKNYNIYFIAFSNMQFINSKYGEQTGNKIIISFAEILSKATGNNGIAARLGGSNFIAVVKKEFKNQFEKDISNKQYKGENESGKITTNLNFTAGLYCIKENENPSTIMNKSAIALDYARVTNRNGIVEFEDFMLEQLLKQKNILAMFDDAIKKEEFCVFYQPKVDIEKGVLCGAEALVRWFHDGKMIFPSDFIPVLEDNGLIEILDFYVLKHVLTDIKEWTSNGLTPVRISTNFSKDHLKNKKFAEKIINLVKEIDVSTEYLEVELTETKDIDDMRILSEFVERMHEHGIHSSIDDFGSGYSSLNLIKNVKADVIKLDKSIIDNIGLKDGDDEILVQNIVRMIAELKRNAIAEGVENKDQAKFLKRIGCIMIQGYLFDKPLPKIEFTKRLENPFYTRIEG